jgi:Family of unknown function (DUF6178)
MERPPSRPQPGLEEHRRPDNVIALSRYRAQLGRGRKLRRGDALLSGPDPERAIRALPGDELYYVIHEIGLRDSGDILALARPEQVQAALDFALWERDQIVPERLGEWLEAMSDAPYDRIGSWFAGLDVELVALMLRRTSRIYDLTQEEPPEEPVGSAFTTPDGFFLLDVHGGLVSDDGTESGFHDDGTAARAMIRLMDGLYRSDMPLARRLIVGARAELDSELEETAYRWRQGRMADLGFHDYYEALEVYRELDPATVRVGETEPGKARVRPMDAPQRDEPPARVPIVLVDRVAAGTTPFARAVQALTSPEEIADAHYALVTLTNRVLAADRVEPGDDPAVAASLERMSATLDIAVELLARGDDAVALDAVRTVPLVRLFRLGVSLVGKVRRLAQTLRRKGPYAATGRDLTEAPDAAVFEAVMRGRPMFPGSLDEPPQSGERPFRSLADLARATAAIELEAAAQAMLLGLGVRPEDIAQGAPALEGTVADDAALDASTLARTVLVSRLLRGEREMPTGAARRAKGDSRTSENPPMSSLALLEPHEVREFEAMLDVQPEGAMKLPETLKKKAKAILDAVSPGRLAGAATKVADRWIAGLAPLEPVLVRRPPPRPRRR